jgi:hypothetical protein
VFKPMHAYQTDDTVDTGEPVLCSDCSDALAVPGLDGRCDDCHTEAGEAQDEQFYSSFHGGTAPDSAYAATYARKR